MKSIELSTLKRHVVCLSGSTRFERAYHHANLLRTMQGQIVLTVGNFAYGSQLIPSTKENLDLLQFDKIFMANETLILNDWDGKVDYIGPSTARDIACAMAAGKKVSFLNEDTGNQFLEIHSHLLGQMIADFLDDKIPKLPVMTP